jgi:hypothetical protein
MDILILNTAVADFRGGEFGFVESLAGKGRHKNGSGCKSRQRWKIINYLNFSERSPLWNV